MNANIFMYDPVLTIQIQLLTPQPKVGRLESLKSLPACLLCKSRDKTSSKGRQRVLSRKLWQWRSKTTKN